MTEQANSPFGAVTGPVKAADVNHGTAARTHAFPAIYDASKLSEHAVSDCLAKAAVMGFNSVLLNTASVDHIHAANSLDLQVFKFIDLARAPDIELVAAHPESFVKSRDGAKFVYLSEADASIVWWSSQFSDWLADGIAGFFCYAAMDVPAFVWRSLIQAAHQHNPSSIFVASIAGATPEQIAGLEGCGFSYSVSSSCWWDFSAGWLNDETERLLRLAPPLALASPPDTAFPHNEAIRRRGLAFAATFGVGWMMAAGFESGEGFDIAFYATELNELRRSDEALHSNQPGIIISSQGAKVALVSRSKTFIFAANTSSTIPNALNLAGVASRLSDTGVAWVPIESSSALRSEGTVLLAPAASRFLRVKPETPILSKRKIAPDCEAPRIALENITPKVDDGRFPVRRIVGQNLKIEADIFADGHDKIAAEILFRPVTDTNWQSRRLIAIGNDRWQGEIPLSRQGRHIYVIHAWKDEYATFVDEIEKKQKAGNDIHLELREAAAFITATAKINHNRSGKPLTAILKRMSDASDDVRFRELLNEETVKWMQIGDIQKFSIRSDEIIVDAERLGAEFANWYEIFPRSQAGDGVTHGTFQDVIAQLPRIAGMGFDVLYFPPIHPIGRINRKGRNNSLIAGPDDPGSPYAIGNEQGGHDAIHPELGTIDEFFKLRDAARGHGIELALDFAIQCAPDHPWLTQHKEWFDWRSDGSLRYAENPPKKYEDIVNVDFYADGSKPSLWIALRDVVQYWVDQGIKLFRVDNPHTKPLPFWEWLIADIRGRHPDVLFLAEAFTRPKPMYRLAKIGFSQSYTYFTWRNTKAELQSYLTELSTTDVREYFRPHFFVNTPDINPNFLQRSGRPGFLIRAALAATLSGLWGVYNGFELCEAAAVPGKEEYLNSEKYQLRRWDYAEPGNIVAEITKLNKIRRTNTALQSHLNIEFHNVEDDQVLFFSKIAEDGNALLIAISLDPFNTHETILELPLWRFGLADDGALAAEDLMRNFQFIWYGKYQPVTLRLDQPFCIWHVKKNDE